MLEGTGTKKQDSLGKHYHCDTAISLWAFLAITPDELDTAINQDAIIRALRALPLHLREVFAPIVSQKMNELGQHEASDVALRSVERATDSLNSEMKMARLQSPKPSIDTAPTEEVIDDLIESNSMQSARAIVEKSQRIIDGEITPSDEDLDLLSSYARQFRNEEIGDELEIFEALILAKFSRIDEAVEKFGNLVQNKSDQDSEEIFLVLSKIVKDSASNIDLLNFSYKMESKILDHLSNEHIQDILKRLALLGANRFDYESTENEILLNSTSNLEEIPELTNQDGRGDPNTTNSENPISRNFSNAALDIPIGTDNSITDFRNILSNSQAMRSELSKILE